MARDHHRRRRAGSALALGLGALAGIAVGALGVRALLAAAANRASAPAPSRAPASAELEEARRELAAAAARLLHRIPQPEGHAAPGPGLQAVRARAWLREGGLPARTRRFLAALRTWMVATHAPDGGPCCGELDSARLPLDADRALGMVEDMLLTLRIQGGSFHSVADLLADGGTTAANSLYNDLTAIAEEAVGRLLETWSRPPLLALGVASRLSSLSWSPHGTRILEHAEGLLGPGVPVELRRGAAHVLQDLSTRRVINPLLTETDLLRTAARLEAEGRALEEEDPDTHTIFLAAEIGTRLFALRNAQPSRMAGLDDLLPRARRAVRGLARRSPAAATALWWSLRSLAEVVASREELRLHGEYQEELDALAADAGTRLAPGPAG